MPLNFDVFSGRTGIIRIATLIIGLIDLAITADKYGKSISKEEFFLSMVIIMFIISLIICLIYVLGVVSATENLKKGDALYHVIGGLLLVISAVVMFVSVFDIGDYCNIFGCRGHYFLRIFAAVLGLLNGILYLVLAFTLYKS